MLFLLSYSQDIFNPFLITSSKKDGVIFETACLLINK
jgi:hypothetical protein